ncbi:DUF739 family protein [Selenomonas sp. AB3002]|uniref:DUF739 family protein n=1 Tax=Selenomonas sp. AB3002 TaxID=1392502 RepID=UPI000496B6C4
MSTTIDYSKLLGRIVEKCGTREAFAKKVGISTVTLAKKLAGKIAFKNDEILTMASVLSIPHEKIHVYFFCDGR